MDWNWTPGPWTVEILTGSDQNGDEWETDVEVAAANGFHIHGHDLGYSDGTDAQIKANALLIAAAPELYAMLKMAQLWLDVDGRFDMLGINAALAKARGQA